VQKAVVDRQQGTGLFGNLTQGGDVRKSRSVDWRVFQQTTAWCWAESRTPGSPRRSVNEGGFDTEALHDVAEQLARWRRTGSARETI